MIALQNGDVAECKKLMDRALEKFPANLNVLNSYAQVCGCRWSYIFEMRSIFNHVCYLMIFIVNLRLRNFANYYYPQYKAMMVLLLLVT